MNYLAWFVAVAIISFIADKIGRSIDDYQERLFQLEKKVEELEDEVEEIKNDNNPRRNFNFYDEN